MIANRDSSRLAVRAAPKAAPYVQQGGAPGHGHPRERQVDIRLGFPGNGGWVPEGRLAFFLGGAANWVRLKKGG